MNNMNNKQLAALHTNLTAKVEAVNRLISAKLELGEAQEEVANLIRSHVQGDALRAAFTNAAHLEAKVANLQRDLDLALAAN